MREAPNAAAELCWPSVPVCQKRSLILEAKGCTDFLMIARKSLLRTGAFESALVTLFGLFKRTSGCDSFLFSYSRRYSSNKA